MATYIYRRASSTAARALSRTFGANGYRWKRESPRRLPQAGDVVVCWGEAAPTNLPAGVLVLNGGLIRNKFADAETLRAAGVSTIEVSRTRPTLAAVPAVAGVDPARGLFDTAQDEAEDFCEVEFGRSVVATTALDQFIGTLTNLRAALRNPVPVATPGRAGGADPNWLPRLNNHVGGNDLLTTPGTPDYFSRKLNLVREYRLHSFDGRSIRAGQKALREGWRMPGAGGTYNPGQQIAHPWVRSFDGGWRIVYDNFESTRVLRELAASAITALGLNFGAVDIGETVDGTYVVLEVNRAPGLEGGTIEAYTNAITRWTTEQSTGRPAQTRRRAA